MKGLKKVRILSILIFLIILMQVSVFADTSSIIDESKLGSITIHVLQDKNGEVVTSNGTGEIQTIPDGATPLSGVKFKIYSVAEDYVDITVPGDATAIGAEKTSDSEGLVEFLDLPVGRYLIEVTGYPSNATVELANFLVDIPMVNSAGTAWNYDVVVYPKIQTRYGSVVLTKLGNEDIKLEGAKFKLLKKDSEGNYIEYTNNEYITNTEYTTNAAGQICIENLPIGDYQLVETEVPEGYGLNTTPIDFSITETSTISGDGTTDSPWVASKAELNLTMNNYITPDSDDFTFNKKIGDSEGSSGSNIDDVQTWKITTGIPADIENYTRYLVTDTISDKLILDLDSISITVDGSALTKDTNYKVYYTDNVLKITFVDEGITPTALKGKSNIEITYETTFNRDEIILGEDIENSASIFWDTLYDEDGDDNGEDPTNPTDEDIDKIIEVEIPANVHTGGLKVKKVDESNNPLPGAKFKIATSRENAIAGVFVTIDGVELESTSGDDGLLYFEGLAYGADGQDNSVASSSYWLVETLAPSGYNTLKEPFEVTIDKDSYTTSNPATVMNKKGIVLPATGGIGTIIFIVIGSAIMFFAIIILVKRDKEEEEEIQRT